MQLKKIRDRIDAWKYQHIAAEHQEPLIKPTNCNPPLDKKLSIEELAKMYGLKYDNGRVG
jgi:hypothetical protein